MWTNAEFQVMFNHVRVIHTKIEVLNMSGNVIDVIEGQCTDGSISITNSNMIRRTLDISFLSDKKLEINPQSSLWINKRLKVYIGIEDFNGKIYYFNQGIYVLNNPTTDITQNGRYIRITASDKMGLFTNPLLTDIKFAKDIPIDNAIKGICDLIGEKNLIIEKSDYTIPYDLQFDIGSTMDNALKEITNLYMNYHSYYNVNGFLVFEKIKNRKNDMPIWEFIDSMDFTSSRSITSDYDNIKNHIKIVGKINEETGILPLYEIKIEGYDKDFSIENIGHRAKVICETKYINEDQCKTRCEYEIEQSQNLGKSFNLESVPIYLINDVNRIIKVKDNGRLYICQIDSISVPLSVGGMMSIQAHEVFI